MEERVKGHAKYELLRNQQRTEKGGKRSSSEGNVGSRFWESLPRITEGVRLVAIIRENASSTTRGYLGCLEKLRMFCLDKNTKHQFSWLSYFEAELLVILYLFHSTAEKDNR